LRGEFVVNRSIGSARLRLGDNPGRADNVCHQHIERATGEVMVFVEVSGVGAERSAGAADYRITVASFQALLAEAVGVGSLVVGQNVEFSAGVCSA
jgi:hypothetical protein